MKKDLLNTKERKGRIDSFDDVSYLINKGFLPSRLLIFYSFPSDVLIKVLALSEMERTSLN